MIALVGDRRDGRKGENLEAAAGSWSTGLRNITWVVGRYKPSRQRDPPTAVGGQKCLCRKIYSEFPFVPQFSGWERGDL